MHIALVIATIVPTLAAASLVAEAKPKGTQAKARASKGPSKGSSKGSVKSHMSRAAQAHKAGNFEVALTELEAAYAIEPQAKLLFAMAQVQQKLERCDDAIGNYEKFLATTKDKQKQTVVKQAIGACSKKLAVAPSREPTPPAPVTTPSPPADAPVFRDKKAEQAPPTLVPETAPVPTEPASPVTDVNDSPLGAGPISINQTMSGPVTTRGKPWYKDVLGDALVVAGVASSAMSVVMYTRARGDLDTAETSGSLGEYEALVSQAHDRRSYAVVFAGAGAVLIGGGLLRYALRDSGEKHTVAVAPTSGGGLVTWGGGF